MSVKPVILLVLLWGGTSFISQKPDKNLINWSKNRKLSWDNFKGHPDNSSAFGAISSTGMGYVTDLRKDTMYVTITCYFSPDKSWVKKKDRKESLLNHEQRHFDLTEIYARLFRKEVKAYSFRFASLNKDLSKVYEEINKKYNQEQSLYDKETEHSKNEQKQEQWDHKIAEYMESLKAYDDSEIKVYIKR